MNPPKFLNHKQSIPYPNQLKHTNVILFRDVQHFAIALIQFTALNELVHWFKMDLSTAQHNLNDTR